MNRTTDESTSPRRRGRRRGVLAVAATGVVSVALAASALIAPATASAATTSAAAPSATTQVHAAQYSEGFSLANDSRYNLRLDQVTGDGNFEGRPDVGSILKPGTSADFEVQYRLWSDQNDHVYYQVLDDQGKVIGTWQSNLSVPGNESGAAISSTTSTYGVATSDGTKSLSLKDPANTVIDLPGTDPVGTSSFQQQQNTAARDQALALCSTSAHCSLTMVGSEQKILGPMQVAGAEVTNIGDGTATHTVSGKMTTYSGDSTGTTTTSVASLKDLIEGQIQTTDHHQWAGQSTEYDDSVSVEMHGNEKSWMDIRVPELRDTGNFTITLGNTTWHIDGVTFDTPVNQPNLVQWYIYTVPINGGTPTVTQVK